jgi:hypothetical protein
MLVSAVDQAKFRGYIASLHGVEVARAWGWMTSEEFTAKYGRELEAKIEAIMNNVESIEDRYAFWTPAAK